MLEILWSLFVTFSCIFLAGGSTIVYGYFIDLVFDPMPYEYSPLGLLITLVGYFVFVGVLLTSVFLFIT